MTHPATPKVGIVIPAYNTAPLIEACLSSVFAQTYSEFEAIVVNDGSPDTPHLEKALGPYLNRIVYVKQENKRAAGARNTAIRRTQGEFLAFLDSDDAWLPDHLSSQIELFRQQPELALVYADSLVVSDAQHSRSFMERCPSQGEATFCALIIERCQIPVSTVVARRSAIVSAGLFDENLQCFDDYDMWLRTAFHGGKIGYTRQVQARSSGKRPGSLSQSASKMAEAYDSILEKALRTLPLSQSERDVITNRLVESRATYKLEEGNRQLRIRQFAKAKELFREANRHFRRPEVSLAVLALAIAPSATGKLIETWSRMRSEQPR
jgi:glycosyltransferase involved in cell wall biosynthesis